MLEYVKVTKSFLNENKCMKGWNPQKTSKLDGNDSTTLSHHTYILCHFAATYTNMLCVCSCAQRRVVEGSVVGNAGCVVHVDVHGE